MKMQMSSKSARTDIATIGRMHEENEEARRKYMHWSLEIARAVGKYSQTNVSITFSNKMKL